MWGYMCIIWKPRRLFGGCITIYRVPYIQKGDDLCVVRGWTEGGIVRLDEGRGGGGLLHLAQDLGVERRTEDVLDLTDPVLSVLPPPLDPIFNHDLKCDRLCLKNNSNLYNLLYLSGSSDLRTGWGNK